MNFGEIPIFLFRMSPNEAFKAAIKQAGGQAALANIVGDKQQKVSYALRSQQRMPAEWVLPAEKATGVSRHELRPDLYPPGELDEGRKLAVGE